MEKLKAYDTYLLYLALKNHFTQPKYDFFKYAGKTGKVNASTFLARKDKAFFYKLANKYRNMDDLQDHIVANLLVDRKWVGQMIDDKANQTYKDYIKRKESVSYQFECDLDNLLNMVARPSELFQGSANSYPPILVAYIQNSITIETMVIINHLVGFVEKFDGLLEDDPFWAQTRMLILKYSPFVNFSEDKIKDIFRFKMIDVKN